MVTTKLRPVTLYISGDVDATGIDGAILTDQGSRTLAIIAQDLAVKGAEAPNCATVTFDWGEASIVPFPKVVRFTDPSMAVPVASAMLGMFRELDRIELEE